MLVLLPVSWDHLLPNWPPPLSAQVQPIDPAASYLRISALKRIMLCIAHSARRAHDWASLPHLGLSRLPDIAPPNPPSWTGFIPSLNLPRVVCPLLSRASNHSNWTGGMETVRQQGIRYSRRLPCERMRLDPFFRSVA